MPSRHEPHGFEQEIDTLLRADGRGYVRVFKFDYERRALLLEQLGLSMQERKYDLGVVMRDWNEELLAAADPLALAHEYCQLLTNESGLDEASIWEWGFIERVSSGLYICAYGSSEHGQPFFKTAQCLLDTCLLCLMRIETMASAAGELRLLQKKKTIWKSEASFDSLPMLCTSSHSDTSDISDTNDIFDIFDANLIGSISG